MTKSLQPKRPAGNVPEDERQPKKRFAKPTNTLHPLHPEVHLVNFIQCPLAKVTCMAFQPITKKLCVGRSDGSLELYLVSEGAISLAQKTVGRSEWQSRRVVWAGERLFTTSLCHQIVEWDLLHLAPKGLPASSHGGAVWDAVSHPAGKVIAVGTEDGHARLFDVEDRGLELRATLPRQVNDRLLALSFSTEPEAARLYLGTCRGFVSCWAWSSKQEVWAANITKCPVWVLRQLDSQLLAVGSSVGRVHLVTAAMGIQVMEIQTHNADIQAMAVFPGSCFVTGVDNRLVMLTYGAKGGKAKWQKGAQHITMHMNDIFVLCPVQVGNKKLLVTGGADGHLFCVNVTKEGNRPQELFQTKVSVSSASTSALQDTEVALYHYGKNIEVWGIPLAWFPGQPGPFCICRYVVQGRSYVACSALSAAASYVAVSTSSRAFVLAIDIDGIVQSDRQPHPLRLNRSTQTALSSVGPCRLFEFGRKESSGMAPSHDSQFLYAVSCCNEVLAVCLKTGTLRKARPDGFKVEPINLLCVDPDEKFLCVGSHNGTILAYSIGSASLQVYAKLPRFSGICSSVTFMHSGQDASVLVTFLNSKSQNDFALYHLVNRALHPVGQSPDMPPVFRKAKQDNVLIGCQRHPTASDVALFYSNRYIWIFSFSEAKVVKNSSTFSRMDQEGELDAQGNHLVLVDVIDTIKEHYLSAVWLSNGSLLACRQGLHEQSFDPALYRKKFAT